MSDHRSYVSTLRASHDHLASVVDDVGSQKMTNPSYCADWNIGQCLSHLGSGAEIGLLNLEAALAGAPAPARERYEEIWAAWNAKSPQQQGADAIASDERHVQRLEALSDAELDALKVPMMGRELDASGFVAMRLFEHAVHTWDVEVMVDPGATIQQGPTDLLIDRLGDRMQRIARGDKPAGLPLVLDVNVTAPKRHFALSIGEESVAMDDGEGTDGHLDIPGEALLRLVTGRLDADHTPAAVSVSGAVDLEQLRALFPGY